MLMLENFREGPNILAEQGLIGFKSGPGIIKLTVH